MKLVFKRAASEGVGVYIHSERMNARVYKVICHRILKLDLGYFNYCYVIFDVII